MRDDLHPIHRPAQPLAKPRDQNGTKRQPEQTQPNRSKNITEIMRTKRDAAESDKHHQESAAENRQRLPMSAFHEGEPERG